MFSHRLSPWLAHPILLVTVFLTLVACTTVVTATPEPTATATSTATPKPTATATSTAAPEPTATPAPTPAPTATLEPTPEPTLTPEPETWVYQMHTDELTGEEYHSIDASGERVPPLEKGTRGSEPDLSLGCISDRFFAINVYWGGEFIAENVRTDVIETQYRVDEGEVKNTGSHESSSNDFSFFELPERFLNDILHGREVIIRVESYDGSTYTARFPLEGLPEAVKQLPCISP